MLPDPEHAGRRRRQFDEETAMGTATVGTTAAADAALGAALTAPLRLAAVERYAVLMAGPDEALDGIVRLAAQLCATPVALLTVVDATHFHVVASHGLRPRPVRAQDAICNDLLTRPEPLVIPDILGDPRTASCWLPRHDPAYRFYAGVPLLSPDGQVVGSLCVLDTVVRELLPERRESLVALAEQAMRLLELRDRCQTLADDLVHRELADDSLRASESQLQSLLDHTGAEVWVKDLQGRYLFANPAYLARVGWRGGRVDGRPDAEVLGAEAAAAARRLEAELARATRPVVRETSESLPNGRRRDYVTVHVPLLAEDGRPHAFAAMATDVTELQQARRELARSVLHDPLTGLPNRTLARDRAERALTRAARIGGSVAALRVDLDGFAAVTLPHGTELGDRVLVAVARRLQAVAGPADTVARIGADDFVVLCEQQPGGAPVEEEARALAGRVMAAVRAPLRVGGVELHLTASLGLALVPARGQVADEAEDLLRDSGAALGQAKALGRDRLELFDQRLRLEVVGRSKVEAALRAALRDGEGLAVHYQPLVDLESGNVVGVEALVRVSAPDGTPQHTDEVIAAAEASGLVVPLGRAVLRQACADVAAWRAATGRPLVLSVNLSARQVARPDLVEVVAAALDASGLPPSALALELTETALLEAAPTAIGSLQRLRDRGVEVGVDDFGTGYASLRYLRDLPVTFLKVDRSFVAGLSDDADDAAIVSAVVGLARALHLECVAEGIESREQLTRLQAHGHLLGQGYLMARPVPAGQVVDLLDAPTLLPQG
jgi:diguanylate cyclase (GGDEF)-like protein/PAS domain S-box-containing protein